VYPAFRGAAALLGLALVLVGPAAAQAPAADAAAGAGAAPDTSVRVPGTRLRFGWSAAALGRRIALRPARATAPPGAALREASVRFYGLAAEATFSFAGDALASVTFTVAEPSTASLDYVEDQLAREGYQRRGPRQEGLERRCDWLGRAHVNLVSTQGTLTVDAEPATPPPAPTPASRAPAPAGGRAPPPRTVVAPAAHAPLPVTVTPAPTPAPAPTSSPALPETLRFTGGAADSLPAPVAIDTCRAERPERARANGVFGRVGVAVLVDTTGVVIDAVITRSVPLLDAAALACAKRYHFEPYRHRGRLARAWVPLSVRFLL
jgi:TonB family protein